MKCNTGTWMLAMLLVATAGRVDAYEPVGKKGALKNSYASQMARVDDSTMRITTRKRISGSLEEVNRPGTTMFNALKAVTDAATVRAAVEAKALGYDVVQILGSRNLSRVQEMRAASKGETPTRDFTFAPGVYHDDVELAIEVVIKGVPGDMPAEPPQDYLDVNAVLKAFNIQ